MGQNRRAFSFSLNRSELHMSRSRIIALRAVALACGIGLGIFNSPAPIHAQVVEHDAMLKVQRDQREMQFKRMQTMVASFPALPAKQVQEVMQLKMDGDALTLVSPLIDPSHGMGSFRVTCDSFKGPTYVSISQMGVFGGGMRAGIKPAGERIPTRRWCEVSASPIMIFRVPTNW